MSNQHTLYTEENLKLLLSSIRGYNINNSHLTPENFINHLPQEKIKEFLNKEIEDNDSCLNAIISSSRKNKIDFFKVAINNGAYINADKFYIILTSPYLEAEKMRREFFDIAMEHIYERAKNIENLDDETFAIISKLEQYLHYSQKRPFCRDLLKSENNEYFPNDFRKKIAKNLYKAQINHKKSSTKENFFEAFKTKLLSYNNFSIKELSEEAELQWQELINQIDTETRTSEQIGLRNRKLTNLDTATDKINSEKEKKHLPSETSPLLEKTTTTSTSWLSQICNLISSAVEKSK